MSTERRRRPSIGLVAGCLVALAAITVTSGCGNGSAATGPSLPASDRPGQEFVFYENFGTDAPLGTFLDQYGDRFTAYEDPAQDTSRLARGKDSGYYDSAKTLSAANGKLDSWLHYDQASGKYLVSALLPKLPTMTAGQFVLRMRADRIAGYKVVPLLWPDSEKWPDDGEVDFPEGKLDGSNWRAAMHYASSTGGEENFDAGVDGSRWHTYEIDWSPGKVDFLVDGKSIGRSTDGVPDKPMHWVWQFETNTDGPPPPKSAQGHVQVDWAKVYRPTG